MKTSELSNGTRVLVKKGLWEGFVGTIEDIHPESSVIRVRNEAGEAAYAMKEDVKAV